MSGPEWIAHDGESSPLTGGATVEVETKDGARYEGRVAGFMRGRWDHSPYLPEGDHIIAYRVLSA